MTTMHLRRLAAAAVAVGAALVALSCEHASPEVQRGETAPIQQQQRVVVDTSRFKMPDAGSPFDVPKGGPDAKSDDSKASYKGWSHFEAAGGSAGVPP